MVDGCPSKLVNVVSECRRAVFWARYCSSCTLLRFLTFWKISYLVIPMTTLMAVVPFPGVWVTAAESQIRDLVRISEWCDLWGKKLNASKTKTMIVSMSRSMPQSPALTIGGTELKESDDLDILGVTSDSKMTFEKHLRSVPRAASQRLGILR